MKTPKCRPGDHIDRPLRRGSKRVKCIKCGDSYPCSHKCEHLDCLLERGEELPDWARKDDDEEKTSSNPHKDRCAPEPGIGAPTQTDHAVAPPIPPTPSARHEQ